MHVGEPKRLERDRRKFSGDRQLVHGLDGQKFVALVLGAGEVGALVGKAYDTLFKELCSAQTLLTPEGRQVLAPFAFVSALAGVLLVVELVRSNYQAATTNYWTVDP